MSSGSARLALNGIAWLLPEGGPFKVPGADMIGVLPLKVGMFGVDVGLSRTPRGVAIAEKVGPWAIAGTAISAMQWARRPRLMGDSQDTVACGMWALVAWVVVGDRLRSR